MPLGIVKRNYYWIRQRPSVLWQPGRSPGTTIGKVDIIGGALRVTGHVRPLDDPAAMIVTNLSL